MTNWQFCRSKLDSVDNTYIDDIPDQVLVEILCRLPSLKFVCQCKVVSKRWCTLTAQIYFMTRFLQNKQTPETSINPKEDEFSPYFMTRFLQNKQTSHTLINPRGEEIFLQRMTQKPLGELFNTRESLRRLNQTPSVVATFNDLVLCCATGYESDCYYICNPFTNQWIALPPPPPSLPINQFLNAGVDPIELLDFRFLASEHRRMGFICDVPYYKYCNKDDDIHFNGEYNCKVVRLIFPKDLLTASKKYFKVQLFSSNTGEWREFIVSSPLEIMYAEISRSFACDGVLYWIGSCGSGRDQFLFGVDPFMLKYEDDNYRCHFLKIDKSGDYKLQCLGVKGDCMQLANIQLDGNNITLRVWDVNVNTVGNVKLSEEMVNIYSLNGMNLNYLHINDMLASDPDDPDVLYFQENIHGRKVIISCNIRTGEWLEMYDHKCPPLYTDDDLFPLALPPWPTPLPRPPVGNRKIFGNRTFCWCAGVILLVLIFKLFVFFFKAQETD